MNASEQLVLQQLVTQQNTSLLEQGIVTFVWMVTSAPEMVGGLESLASFTKKLDDDWGVRISAESTHASLIVGTNDRDSGT